MHLNVRCVRIVIDMINKHNKQEQNMTFLKWFKTFIDEKNLPMQEWVITDKNGIDHFITSEVVIEAVKSASKAEQAQIKNTIVKIDFLNGNVMHFFNHLAKGLVNNYANA